VSRYLTSDRLRSVVIGSTRVAEDVAAAITKASISASTTQTTQLVMQIVDPALALLTGSFAPKRTPVLYATLKLEVAVREIIVVGTSTPALQLTCRSQGIQTLKRATGARTWGGLSYTDWLRQQCAAVGLGFVGQPSAKRTIARTVTKGQPPQSTWEVATNGASDLGFLLFEAGGVVYFGQPTWLAAHLPQVSVRWAGAGGPNTTPGLTQVPTVRDSDDDPTVGYTGLLACVPDLAETLAPPCAITVEGIGPYSARYLATDLELDLDGVTTASVSIATPVNPAPVTDSTSTASTSAAVGYNNATGNATGPAYKPTPIYKPDQVQPASRPYVNGGGGHRLG
jgi:hypothetical protein